MIAPFRERGHGAITKFGKLKAKHGTRVEQAAALNLRAVLRRVPPRIEPGLDYTPNHFAIEQFVLLARTLADIFRRFTPVDFEDALRTVRSYIYRGTASQEFDNEIRRHLPHHTARVVAAVAGIEEKLRRLDALEAQITSDLAGVDLLDVPAEPRPEYLAPLQPDAAAPRVQLGGRLRPAHAAEHMVTEAGHRCHARRPRGRRRPHRQPRRDAREVGQGEGVRHQRRCVMSDDTILNNAMEEAGTPANETPDVREARRQQIMAERNYWAGGPKTKALRDEMARIVADPGAIAKQDATRADATPKLSATERELAELRNNPKLYDKNDPEQPKLVQRLKQLIAASDTPAERAAIEGADLTDHRAVYGLQEPDEAVLPKAWQ